MPKQILFEGESVPFRRKRYLFRLFHIDTLAGPDKLE